MKFYVKRRRTPQIIIVSLIDIFAILLIFFIVTTTFRTVQSQLSINLPDSKTATVDKNPAQPVIVAITSDQKIYVDSKPLDGPGALASMLRDLREKDPNKPIALSTSKEVSWGFVIQVFDALKQAGIKNLPAFTQPREQK
jgi:biopolymer transport protein ExbD